MINDKQRYQLWKYLLLVLLPILIYTLLLAFPIPRQIGLTFRYGFTTTIITLLLILGLSYWLSGLKGTIIGLCVTAGVFAMPLSGLWSSGQSEQYLLAGLLPFSDAMNYHADALRLIEGMPFTSFSARRPLFPAFMAFVMWITKQNLQISLAILGVMTALACYLATREIQSSHGIGAGIFFIIVLFLFYRPMIGKVLTEHIGLIFGALGFTLLWRGAVSKKSLDVFTGIFFVSYALNARAGAFFILPALMLWVAWLFKEQKGAWVTEVGWSLGAVLLGFFVNILVFRALVGNGVPFSNFGNTVYGLVSGGNSWTHIYDQHPEVWLMEEPQLSRRIYDLSFELFRNNPLLTVVGSLKSWGEFFSLQWYSAFCFIGGDEAWTQISSRLGMYGLSILGIIKWYRNRSDARLALLTFSVIGIVLSIPFVPPMDANRMRAHAAIIPFFLALPAMGFTELVQFFKTGCLLDSKIAIPRISFPKIYGVGIVLATIVGSLVIKWTSTSPEIELFRCTQGDEAIWARVSPGSYIHTVKNDAIVQDWLPKVRINRFLLSAHNLPNWEFYPILDQVMEGTLITNAIDLDNGDFVLIIDAKRLIPDGGGLIGFCGKRDTDIGSVFYPEYIAFYAVE